MDNKQSKIKSIFLSIFNVLKQFPVAVFLIILIPSLIYTGQYLTKARRPLYDNYYFFGERVPIEYPADFKIKEIKPLFGVHDLSYVTNYQGGTCYENYYVLCSNNFDAILIYDMETQKVAHAITTNQRNTDYHCNTIFFGTFFYDSRDKFPLLYISMENAPVHSIIVFRLYEKAGEYVAERIQKITLEWEKDEPLYFPNAYYDYDTGEIYYAGYTKDSYRKSADNKLKYFVFDVPDFRKREAVLKTSEANDSFELPSETATQGGFISGGHLFQTFSFHHKSSEKPDDSPKMRIVDLHNHEIVYDNQDLGLINGVYDEFENIAISRSGRMYAHGNIGLKIYEFIYTTESQNG